MLKTMFALLLIAISVSCLYIYHCYIFLQKYSITKKAIAQLNREYSFYSCRDYQMSFVYDSETNYYQISCEDYLIYQLQFHSRAVLQDIERIHKNKADYMKYDLKLRSVNQIGCYEKSIGILSQNLLKKLETKLCKKMVKHPCTEYSLLVTLMCSTINGKIHQRKRHTFYEDQIISIIQRLKNKNGFYFNDKAIWDSICRVERGRVSNRMRFSIYKRDGYRCRICGVTDAQAALEIDHIIPIAKGGRSNYENLQTLCHRCNVEKGATMPYYPHNKK